jgi:hypothetical protein
MGQEVAGSSKINLGKGEGIEPQRHGGHSGEGEILCKRG